METTEGTVFDHETQIEGMVAMYFHAETLNYHLSMNFSCEGMLQI